MLLRAGSGRLPQNLDEKNKYLGELLSSPCGDTSFTFEGSVHSNLLVIFISALYIRFYLTSGGLEAYHSGSQLANQLRPIWACFLGCYHMARINQESFDKL